MSLAYDLPLTLYVVLKNWGFLLSQSQHLVAMWEHGSDVGWTCVRTLLDSSGGAGGILTIPQAWISPATNEIRGGLLRGTEAIKNHKEAMRIVDVIRKLSQSTKQAKFVAENGLRLFKV
eukprot:scaffold7243_cov394-Prasinococcus_capsulatus_cf.AAC.27